MTYEQYWYGDVWMVEAFREKSKLDQQQRDITAWLNGLYVLQALNATVGNMGKQGKAPNEYPKQPLYVDSLREKTEEEKKREIENERLRAYAQFDLLIRRNKERRGEA